MTHHLRHDVRRCTETVDAHPLRLAGEQQRAIADQPRAEQRCRFDIVVLARKRKRETLVRDRVVGIAAIDVETRKASAIAQILLTRPAVSTRAAGPTEPRHADTVA